MQSALEVKYTSSERHFCAVKYCLVRTFSFLEKFSKKHKNENTWTLLHHIKCTPPHTHTHYLMCNSVSGRHGPGSESGYLTHSEWWLLHGQRQSRGTEGPLCINTHTHMLTHTHTKWERDRMRKRERERERERDREQSETKDEKRYRFKKTNSQAQC